MVHLIFIFDLVLVLVLVLVLCMMRFSFGFGMDNRLGEYAGDEVSAVDVFVAISLLYYIPQSPFQMA